ncbi:hypothetical protein GCM10009007_15080 [Formosimonas limnophila]|uniref:Uncharacterized protein n=1 Tax=Formosimonas limnophila TaxID=1384487 RepID=A0A8J3CNB8_9BURK|nr:hypothetical protein [Formosimonas limnophila]GHA74970.1 hypothetical protein GCM10009007_15080 [Formosimonas limnophila]
MADLNIILQEKERALEYAEKEVVELKQQIQSLRQTIAMLGTTTLFESALKSSQVVVSLQKEKSNTKADDIYLKALERIEKASKPKGALSQAILEVLSDGAVRDSHEVFSEVSKKLATTLRSVQVTLGNLKNRGELKSVSYGKYQFIKDESPTIGVVGDSIL